MWFTKCGSALATLLELGGRCWQTDFHRQHLELSQNINEWEMNRVLEHKGNNFEKYLLVVLTLCLGMALKLITADVRYNDIHLRETIISVLRHDC